MVWLIIPNLRDLQKLMGKRIHKKVGIVLELSRNIKENKNNMTVLPVIRNLTVNLN
jgi:hypothetical protein